MPRLEHDVPKVGEKGMKVILLEGQGLEVTRCLKLVKWRSWLAVGGVQSSLLKLLLCLLLVGWVLAE